MRTPTRLLGAFTESRDVARAFANRLDASRQWSDCATLLTAESPAGYLTVFAEGTARAPVRTASHPDGSFAVVDGEFYWDEPVSNDAEEVLERYASGGIDALNRLDGSATLTLWDARGQRLVVTRDPDGVGHCFYAPQAGALYWSSDFRSLLPYTADAALDLNALDFLVASGFSASPQTLVRGIRRLGAGKVLVAWSPSTPRVEPGQRYTGRPKQRMTREERSDGFGEHLERAIRRRYEHGRPAAVLLSGGVDSTLLLGMLARGLGTPVPGYTFRYEEYEGWKNESPGARQAAEHFGVPHYEIPVTPREVADRLPEMVEQYGEPFTWGVHSFKLDALADAGVEVVYSGQGSGWYSLRREAMALQYARLPGPVRRLLRIAPPLLAGRAPGLAARLNGVFHEAPSLAERAFHESVTKAEVRATLLSAPGAAERRSAAVQLYADALGEYEGEADLDRLTFVNQRFHAADHTTYWNGRWARAHDLVMRIPYRDRDLKDFVFHMHRPEPGKRAQRRFAETLMPRELAYAPKLHQHAPIIEWMRGGPFHDFVREELSDRRLRESGLFEPLVVHRLLDEHRDNLADHAWTIWTVLTTVLWQERVLNASRQEAATR